ncbi:MIP/aquaporin family protein [Sphingomonas sp. SRS2]|uniref:MIP/aquaporin family protein n=1 Tax=Sphingomonas sp. SRS2 TaxID=133190 RepID=UPI000618499A|nr:MIP/aquaporin family protein [Sphingomonas sp. SRS2]KKC27128.1 MIP family channel protein [Sphingomonas sp. SRS2]
MIRHIVAEGIGTAFLLAIVVGSGIMGERLSGGNEAIALLGNSIATGAGLIVLIHVFSPISGAHFNPVVTLAFAFHREVAPRTAGFYIAAQCIGAVLGVWTAHAMFAEPLIQLSYKVRAGPAQGFSEMIATFGLIGTIFGMRRSRPEQTPAAIGLYITAAYWFTASTSFANPAVTIARSLSNSFSGIAPTSVSLFLAGQISGAVAAVIFFRWLFADSGCPEGQASL